MLIVRTCFSVVQIASVLLVGFVSSVAVGEGIDPQLIESYRRGPAHWPAFVVDAGVDAQEIGPLSPPPAEPQALVDLGRTLFFDPRLSQSGQIACASCHDPDLGWGDGRRFAFGHNRQSGHRNTMSLLNSGLFQEHFWDGRVTGLEEQALHPIVDPREMASSLPEVTARLRQIEGYLPLFEAAFGTPGVDTSRLAQALAAFERTLYSRPNRFDRFAAGEGALLSAQEIEGLHLFRTQALCMNCHHGALFSDGRYHHTGLAYFGRRYEDLGRYEVSGDRADLGAFRTPTLRDLLYTGPWMHNGLFPSLRGILNMYNLGMRRTPVPPGEVPLSPLLHPLDLEPRQLAALEAFLETLSRRPAHQLPPALPAASVTLH